MGACNSKSKKNANNNEHQQKTNNEQNVIQNEQNQNQTNSPQKMKVGPDIFVSLKKDSITQNYKIQEVLGEGAFGKVCKVTSKTSGIVRAMKSIKKKSIIKEDEEKMFAEMQILRGLDHPNIIQIYELYQDESNYYLITEICQGGELFDRIKNSQMFTEKMAADYMKQILSAIYYCHNMGVVHRDLKPENLLLVNNKSNSNLKVIDFGTARNYSSDQKMTKRLGTPYYIAPEVLSQNYDEKCDVWSCGVILYILLCGYPPFSGHTQQEILSKVKAGKFKFDPEDWEKISDDAKNLISKMLTYNPKNRISAEQALNDSWIQKNASNHSTLSVKFLNNMTQFHCQNKLKSAIMTFIATQMISNQEKEEIQKQFKALDKNGDGTLTRQELIDGFQKAYSDKAFAEDQVDKIINQIDNNQSGVIDYTEFIIAAMSQEKLLSKQRVEQTFKQFDLDGNGFISRQELEQIMGGTNIDDSTWNEILRESDTNNDGQISQQELEQIMGGTNIDDSTWNEILRESDNWSQNIFQYFNS